LSDASESREPGGEKLLAGKPETDKRTGPFLVVGLGNPGPDYFWTPHNAGFMAIDRIAEQEDVVVQNRRSKATTTTFRLAGRQVILAKPETFMNLSGLAVAALVREFELDPLHDMLVIYDELDLALGTIKIRERGSPAGHNGARSVTSALGSQEWLRLRIGVGLASDGSGSGQASGVPPEAVAAGGRRRPGRDYLLSPMRKADLAVLDEVLDKVATATRRIIQDGPGPAMNEFNRRNEGGE
jgi:PTH1 family peptidyl-tRNA hydrolase